jgi:LPXTG-motif cell wall-anchored protein
MSARHRPSTLRVGTARIAVAGAAGLASVLAIAPVAVADDAADTTGPADTTASETPGPVEETPPTEDAPTPTDETPSSTDVSPDARPDAGARGEVGKAAKVAAAPVEANFGFQKFRVGVKVSDGSWVPAGTTTVGTEFTIARTNVEADYSDTFTCTTDAETVEEPSTASFCIADRPSLAKAAATGGVEVDPDDPDAPSEQLFVAAPGETVTITQTTVQANLVRTTKVATIEPCEVEENDFICSSDGPQGDKQVTVLFDDPGLPPIAKDDTRTTDEGQPIDIRVLSNDDSVNGAPVTDLDVVSDPGHGKAKVDGRLITYTPDAGFSGKDTFDYTYATANGTATATVTVTIVPAVSPDAVLPDTGGDDVRVLGLGLLLLLGGGWLTARGRRRPRAHATVD